MRWTAIPVGHVHVAIPILPELLFARRLMMNPPYLDAIVVSQMALWKLHPHPMLLMEGLY
jgi:hypothetical protein